MYIYNSSYARAGFTSLIFKPSLTVSNSEFFFLLD